MGAIPLGKGGERFPPLSTSKTPDLGGGIWGGGRRRPLDALWSGWSEGRKGRVGEKRPARAQDIGLVAPARLARQGGHVIADAAQRWFGPPAWPPCRATCIGATEAICRAGASGATKWGTSCK